MPRDIRNTTVFHEAERIFEEVYRPGEDFIGDIADLQLSSEASRLLLTGTLVNSLHEPVETRICEFDLGSRLIQILTVGPNSDRHARTSPDRTTIAFLSDRDRVSDFQLFFLDPRTHTVTVGPRFDGSVEYFEWSPDGRRILLGVAGPATEAPSSGDACTTGEVPNREPSWLPHVIGSISDSLSRKNWIFEVDTGQLSWAASGSETIWGATWCGKDQLAAITSDGPDEGDWYGAELSLINLPSGITVSLYKPVDQIASPKSSPSGKYVAFIEAISSDRGHEVGDLRLCDLRDGTCRLLAADNVDTAYIEWRADDLLLVAGHRGLETVVLLIDVEAGTSTQLWQSCHHTTSERYATVLGLYDPEDFAFICESFFQRPQIATVQSGSFQVAKARVPDADWSRDCSGVETVKWQAPDGLQIEGWLLRPGCEPPYATILHIHGGPVTHWRPYWLGRAASTLMLLRRGYAIFLPNMRGSSGRGQAFAARIIGDVGGADTADFLSGIDHLIRAGIADPSRLGVTGLSYGGFMTCWLTTQDSRFGAAIAIGPATNHVSHHLSCNIPQFVSLFLNDHYTNLAGAYYSRSPLLHAHRSRTPTLLVCGDLDKCTPPAEALQFHHALLENGVDSVVVRYPEEGHGVRGMPAAIDFAARCVMWFERHIPARVG